MGVALTGPRSVAINSLHPCSHWPLFAIAPTHEWIGNGANQTCTWAFGPYFLFTTLGTGLNQSCLDYEMPNSILLQARHKPATLLFLQKRELFI